MFFKHPILVTGPPRSGTSMIGGLLYSSGIWMPKSDAELKNTYNSKGFFENTRIRDGVNKAALAFLNCDIRGIHPRPIECSIFNIKEIVLTHLYVDNYPDNNLWFFKDAKTILLWKMWNKSYPKAIWLLCKRNKKDIIDSCMRSFISDNYPKNEDFWKEVIDDYIYKMEELEKHVDNCYSVNTDSVVNGDFSQIKKFLEDCEIQYDSEIEQFVDHNLWNNI